MAQQRGQTNTMRCGTAARQFRVEDSNCESAKMRFLEMDRTYTRAAHKNHVANTTIIWTVQTVPNIAFENSRQKKGPNNRQSRASALARPDWLGTPCRARRAAKSDWHIQASTMTVSKCNDRPLCPLPSIRLVRFSCS